jgi:hypothetical protein
MVFYNEDTAIETSFEMKPYRPGTRSQESNGMQFRFISFDSEQNATEHCSGILHHIYETAPNVVDAVNEFEVSWKSRVAEQEKALDKITLTLDSSQMYTDVMAKGLEFGPMFQNMTNMRCGKSSLFSPFRPVVHHQVLQYRSRFYQQLSVIGIETSFEPSNSRA